MLPAVSALKVLTGFNRKQSKSLKAKEHWLAVVSVKASGYPLVLA